MGLLNQLDVSEVISPSKKVDTLWETLTKTMENHHAMNGKSTISTGPFSMSQTVNVYQRVSTQPEEMAHL